MNSMDSSLYFLVQSLHQFQSPLFFWVMRTPHSMQESGKIALRVSFLTGFILWIRDTLSMPYLLPGISGTCHHRQIFQRTLSKDYLHRCCSMSNRRFPNGLFFHIDHNVHKGKPLFTLLFRFRYLFFDDKFSVSRIDFIF